MFMYNSAIFTDNLKIFLHGNPGFDAFFIFDYLVQFLQENGR